MKIFNFELSDWTNCSDHTYTIPNWYRYASPWNVEHTKGYDFAIGFIQQNNTIIIEEQTWIFDCIGIGPFLGIHKLIYSMWEEKYSDRSIPLKELDVAKQSVDNLIIRVNNLKVFI